MPDRDGTDAADEQIVRLSEPGQRLWDRLAVDHDLDGPAGILAAEACRIVDRLTRLDGALRSKGHDWLALSDEVEAVAGTFGAVEVRVVVDGVLSEARQQANALRQVLAQLGVSALPERPSEQVGVLSVLRERRGA